LWVGRGGNMSLSTRLFVGMLMAQMIADERRKLHGIDIEREYALIQQKKSSLSRSMRDLVVRAHERGREVIEEKRGDFNG